LTLFPNSYNIVYFILTYIVPIVAMGVSYGRIGFVLWGKTNIRENACNDLAHERKLTSKRKVSEECKCYNLTNISGFGRRALN
jgi:hypothetical protein